MHPGRIVFSQILDFLPRYEFNKCVQRYQGNYRIRKLSCYDQFLCIAFAQLTYRESLRDIETCLRALQPKLYHAGIHSKISRSTLAEANENRDWRIYSDFAHGLIRRARQLYTHEDFGVTLNQTAYAFDSTTIDLCLSLFPWASVPPAQSRHQNSYAHGSARQHPLFYPHHQRQNPRCPYPRRIALGARILLHHGSGLYRFSSPLSLYSAVRFLHYPGQVQSRLYPTFLLSCRQTLRGQKRSDNCTRRTEDVMFQTGQDKKGVSLRRP
jgi:hypothetical protein